MKPVKITPSDLKVLDAIVAYIDEHQYPPTVRELCDMTGFNSTQSIALHMSRLFAEGYIETDVKTAGSPRAFRLGERAKTEDWRSQLCSK